MAQSSVQSGQVWKDEQTGESWLVTKVYQEAFSRYAMLRKVGTSNDEVRRVKIENSFQGKVLPGFIFANDPGEIS